MKRLLPATAVLLAATLATAQEGSPDDRRRLVEQKIRLVEMLVNTQAAKNSAASAPHAPERLEKGRNALALANQPRTDLFALDQGWMDTIAALDAAQETGSFVPSTSRAQAEARHAALQQFRGLRAQAAELRARAMKERQLARQVALNEELRRISAQMESLRQQLMVGGG